MVDSVLDDAVDVEVRFEMARLKDGEYPCNNKIDDSRCRKCWDEGLCPGSLHSTPQCVARRDLLTEVDPKTKRRSMSVDVVNISRPYREAGATEHIRQLLYRYMAETRGNEPARRAATA